MTCSGLVKTLRAQILQLPRQLFFDCSAHNLLREILRRRGEMSLHPLLVAAEVRRRTRRRTAEGGHRDMGVVISNQKVLDPPPHVGGYERRQEVNARVKTACNEADWRQKKN